MTDISEIAANLTKSSTAFGSPAVVELCRIRKKETMPVSRLKTHPSGFVTEMT